MGNSGEQGTQPVIINNEKDKRFEWTEGDATAYIQYSFYKGDIAFMHTVVPPELQGKGAGSALAKYALDHAAAKRLKIMVYCPFVSAFIRKNPEYRYLIDKAYTGGR